MSNAPSNLPEIAPSVLVNDGVSLAPDATAANSTAQQASPTAGHASISDEGRKFLENVLVWPADINSPHGWINVHVNAKNKNPSDTSPKNNGGKPWVVGRPFKTINEVLNRINWVESTADFFNVGSACRSRAR